MQEVNHILGAIIQLLLQNGKQIKIAEILTKQTENEDIDKKAISSWNIVVTFFAKS